MSSKRIIPAKNGRRQSAIRYTPNLSNGKNGDSAYHAAPVAYSRTQRYTGQALRSRRVRNSELVANVNGSILFGADTYSINPGLADTFPWLSTIAVNWQQYRIHMLQFRYVTRTATTTVGSVILSPDYNPVDPVPTSEPQATNTQDAVEDVTWRDICCRLDVAAMHPLGSRKMIRSAVVTGDYNLYDAGTMSVCTIGEIGTDPIGKIWVDYDIELFVPQNSPRTYTMPQEVSVFSGDAAQAFNTGVADDVEFKTTVYDPLSVGDPVNGVFQPVAGTYHVTFQATASDTHAETFTATINLTVNGVSQYRVIHSATSLAGGQIPLSIEGVVAVDGGDDVAISITMTGAAGALALEGGNAPIRPRVIFERV